MSEVDHLTVLIFITNILLFRKIAASHRSPHQEELEGIFPAFLNSVNLSDFSV
jgi:hypothetical protein